MCALVECCSHAAAVDWTHNLLVCTAAHPVHMACGRSSLATYATGVILLCSDREWLPGALQMALYHRFMYRTSTQCWFSVLEFPGLTGAFSGL